MFVIYYFHIDLLIKEHLDIYPNDSISFIPQPIIRIIFYTFHIIN